MSERGSGRAPRGPGWSAEPEPVPVSALTGNHPSRTAAPDGGFEKHVADMVEDLREAMERRRTARIGTDAPGQAWDDIASVLCTHVGSFEGPLFGDLIVERLSAPAMEARRAGTQGGPVHDSAVREAKAPHDTPPLAEGDAHPHPDPTLKAGD